MSDPEARDELVELVRQTRAWVQWLEDSGVDWLASRPAERVASESVDEPPRDEPPRDEPPAAPALEKAVEGPRFRAPDFAAPKLETPAASGRSPASAPASDIPRPPTPEARAQRLAALAQQVQSCTRCRLHESRTQPAFSRGSPETELVFVGEGPGAEEDRQGLPFVGPAGQLLDKMIVAMGYDRDDVYICNIVKCRPPGNRKPEPDEVAACAPYLREQLAVVAPKVIVALGATGVQGLVGTTIGITRLRGNWKLYRGRVPIMPTFHPAYLLRQPEKKRDVWDDLQQVMTKLGNDPSGKGGKRRPDSEPEQ